MTTAATIAALQAVHAAVSGVAAAPTGTSSSPIPGSVPTTSLPMVLMFPGAIDLSAMARNEIDEARTYSGIVLVAGQAQGTGINDTVNAVWTLIDAFMARYETLIGTPEKLSTGEVVTSWHSDGQQAITYRGATWEGFIFRVELWQP